MKLKLDSAGLSKFGILTGGNGRSYFVTRAGTLPMAILVSAAGGLVELRERVVDANVGWDAGTQGFVLEQDIGRRHTKITVYRMLGFGEKADLTLSQVLAKAPMRDRR